MKVNVFLLIVALVIGGLLFYGFHALDTSLLFSIPGAVLCTVFLITSMSLSLPESPRSSLMFRTLGGILFMVLLIADLIFIRLEVSEAVFIVTNGLVAAIGATGMHFIYKSEQ